MNITLPEILVVCGVLIAAFLVLFMPLPGSRTKASTPVERPNPDTDIIYRDDDRYWYGGIFYYNPDDPAVLVPRRYGFGWTINFGNPRGRMIMIAILLMVLLFGVIIPVLAPAAASYGCHPSGCHLTP